MLQELSRFLLMVLAANGLIQFCRQVSAFQRRREIASSSGEKFVLAVAIGEHRYVINADAGREQDVLDAAAAWARDSELNFGDEHLHFVQNCVADHLSKRENGTC